MVNKFAQQKPKVLIGNNQLVITVNPFDNFFKFTLSRLVNDEIVRYDLNDYTELKMTVKGPKNDLNFNVFRESTDNDFENGVIVFKISESMNSELQRLAKKNFNLFYINGVDVFGNRQIIYSGFYKMWDSKLNIQKLEQEYNESNAFVSTTITQNNPNSQEQDTVNDSLNQSTNTDTTTNTSGVPTSQQISNQNTDLSNFRPRYRATDWAISIGLAPPVNDKLDYRGLSTLEKSQLVINFQNRNYWTSSSSSETSFTIQDLSTLFPGVNTTQSFDINLFADYVEAYFKGLDILPNTTVLDNWFLDTILKNDLTKYIKNKPFRISEIITGEYLPVTPEQKSYFNFNNIPLFTASKPSALVSQSSALLSSQSRSLFSGQSRSLLSGQSITQISTQSTTQLSTQSNTTSSSAQNTATEPEQQRLIGIVVDNDTSDQLQGVQVTISSLANIFAETTVISQANGTFDFGPIDNFPSDCRFVALKSGFIRTQFELSQDEILDEIRTGGVRIKIINQN